MKKNLLKINIFAFMFVAILAGFSLVKAQEVAAPVNEAPATVKNLDEDSNRPYQNMMRWDKKDFGNDQKDFGMMKDFLPSFAAGFVGLGIVAGILGLALLAFWIWMMVHAITHDIDYKPVWILVLWFMNIIGAVVYYFAVKRQCPCCQDWEDYCYCEDGKCACDDHEEVKEEIKEEVKEEVKND